jgi:hypothetical protein
MVLRVRLGFGAQGLLNLYDRINNPLSATGLQTSMKFARKNYPVCKAACLDAAAKNQSAQPARVVSCFAFGARASARFHVYLQGRVEAA